jgi:hypothetical protein
VKILIGKSPMDVKVLDDSGQKIDLHIRRVGLEITGGVIPVATLEVELLNDCEIELAEFDLVGKVADLRKLAEVNEEDGA